MLYQKYRSQNFADVVGQDIIKRTLQNSIKMGRIAHAYVFSGPRGTGKTSMARIFAKAINCENVSKEGEPCNRCDVCKQITDGQSVDVIEIDAASHTGVDDIRLLIEKVEFAPTKLKKKVYIIDEVHMLSRSAFNAMLKTLEEPPVHAVFVLATTEIHKIPITILSRCQRFDFRLGTEDEIVALLKNVAESEKIKIDERVFPLVAKLGQGSYRDSITTMDRILGCKAIASDKEISLEEVRGFLGIPDDEQYSLLLENLILKDVVSSLTVIEDILSAGASVKYLSSYFLEYLRTELISGIMKNQDDERISVILEIIREFGEADKQISGSSVQRLPLEMAIIQLCGLCKTEKIVIKKEKTNKRQKTVLKETAENSSIETSSEVNVETLDNSLKTLSLENIHTDWQAFIDAVKPYNGHLYAFVAKSSIVNYKEGILTLEVPYGFYKEQIEDQKSTSSLLEASKKVYGSGFRIKCLINKTTKESVSNKGEDSGKVIDEAVDVFDEDVV